MRFSTVTSERTDMSTRVESRASTFRAPAHFELTEGEAVAASSILPSMQIGAEGGEDQIAASAIASGSKLQIAVLATAP
jgi:hypothetical protein